jgi:hypothetical protein
MSPKNRSALYRALTPSDVREQVHMQWKQRSLALQSGSSLFPGAIQRWTSVSDNHWTGLMLPGVWQKLFRFRLAPRAAAASRWAKPPRGLGTPRDWRRPHCAATPPPCNLSEKNICHTLTPACTQPNGLWCLSYQTGPGFCPPCTERDEEPLKCEQLLAWLATCD